MKKLLYGTVYLLTICVFINCSKDEDTSCTAPSITENIVGTWSVTNIQNEGNEGTVTFNADGMGAATPADSAFAPLSETTSDPSEGFNWSYDTASERLMVQYLFPNNGSWTFRYRVDSNDCEEVTLVDVSTVANPQLTYRLVRN